MNVIRIDLPRDLELVELHTFADEHIGDEHCDIKRLMERIEHVKNTPNAYCILNGDLLDNATKTSIGDTYTQVFSPMEQLERAVKLFAPIKDKSLCITHTRARGLTSLGSLQTSWDLLTDTLPPLPCCSFESVR